MHDKMNDETTVNDVNNRLNEYFNMEDLDFEALFENDTDTDSISDTND